MKTRLHKMIEEKLEEIGVSKIILDKGITLEVERYDTKKGKRAKLLVKYK